MATLQEASPVKFETLANCMNYYSLEDYDKYS